MLRFRRICCATCIILLWSQATAWTQTQSAKPVSPAAATTKPPSAETNASQAAVVYECRSNVLNFESNGTGTRETTVVARVQSPAGVKDLAILTFAYTSYNQVVDIVYVRVRKPDGTVVETPPANVQDMPSAITRGAPMYSDLQEKHVTLKALGVGDVVEYQVRYRTVRPQVEGEFWFQQNFTKLFVVKEEVLEISVPRDKYVKVTSPGYPPAVTEDKTKRTYTWKTANPTVKEGSLLTLLSEEATPSVDLTTFKDWAQVGSWYQSLAQPQMTVTPQIRAKAAELTRGLTSDDDKIRAIYSFVSTNFHYVSLSFGVGRYQPHAAQEVLETSTATAKTSTLCWQHC